MKKTVISFVTALSLLGGACLPADALAAHGKKSKTSHSKTHGVAKSAHHHKAKAKKTHKSRHAPKVGAAAENPQHLVLQSTSVMVQDQTTGAILFEKNAGAVVPIASISKLMTAMVSLDAQPDLREAMVIGDEDVDTLKGTHSRLKVGTRLSREEMLRLALMSSENRAASALSRYYPGGKHAFVAAMNRKALSLGLTETHFEDPTGLTAANVSSARDLTKMVAAAHQYPLIREFTTTAEWPVTLNGHSETFRNTNLLVRSGTWDIGLSKTGFINEAGKCLVMQAWFNNKPMIIVLLDSWGKLTRIGDAQRIKRWVESAALARRTTTG
ncbi:MAG: D-alanyl-D-alanine endopeptidase [Proteobacteria bacterium]|nr:D-alanyl-D-alanine endopeptidase [Pseudomonadota bacterium]HQR04570.1 D-alanyl-D-alanine endopeptidase [Rhodocyclaceae bacterium]